MFVSPVSWFWGPVVTLQDCLAAFFARDELKGKRVGGKICCASTNIKNDVSIIVCFVFLIFSLRR